MDVPTHTLRRLCNSGLIPHIKRNRYGHRVLAEWQLDLAKILVEMRKCGFRNNELRRYARYYRQGDATKADRCAMLTTRKRQLWQEIVERQQAIDFIERQEELLQD